MFTTVCGFASRPLFPEACKYFRDELQLVPLPRRGADPVCTRIVQFVSQLILEKRRYRRRSSRVLLPFRWTNSPQGNSKGCVISSSTQTRPSETSPTMAQEDRAPHPVRLPPR